MSEHFQNVVLQNQNINEELPVFKSVIERFENRAMRLLNCCVKDMAECCICDPYIEHDRTGSARWLSLLAAARERNAELYVRLLILRGSGTVLNPNTQWGYVLVPVIGPNGWMSQEEFDRYKECLKPYINELIALLRWLNYAKE